MKGRAKALLFLMEQLVVITVFAICAAVCAAIFAASYITAHDARDLNYALIAAKNGAETYKAAGNLEETAEILKGQVDSQGSMIVYFDGDWRASGETGAEYALRFTGEGPLPYVYELSVQKITGEEIISFTVAAGGEGGDLR